MTHLATLRTGSTAHTPRGGGEERELFNGSKIMRPEPHWCCRTASGITWRGGVYCRRRAFRIPC